MYERFMVLNEINNIRVYGEKISVEQKQELYRDLFMAKKKVTIKDIEKYFVKNGTCVSFTKKVKKLVLSPLLFAIVNIPY